MKHTALRWIAVTSRFPIGCACPSRAPALLWAGLCGSRSAPRFARSIRKSLLRCDGVCAKSLIAPSCSESRRGRISPHWCRTVQIVRWEPGKAATLIEWTTTPSHGHFSTRSKSKWAAISGSSARFQPGQNGYRGDWRTQGNSPEHPRAGVRQRPHRSGSSRSAFSLHRPQTIRKL